MNNNNHKTVFVLDHTHFFGQSAEVPMELDFGKNKTNVNFSIPPVCKSLWTVSVEASIEYCRIVWDIFPEGKSIRFIVSDSNAHIVNTWLNTTQNLQNVLNAMALVGVPPREQPQTKEYSVVHGLRAAIEAIAEPTEQQMVLLNQPDVDKNEIPNYARVICITSTRDDDSMKSIEDIMSTIIIKQNVLSATLPNQLMITHCHFVVINLFLSQMELSVSERSITNVSPLLKTEIHCCKAIDISNKLTHFILTHYDLASTTVTGIPMKEEQNASSSANYDVEIFHPSKAHTIILGIEFMLPTSIKVGSAYETVTLKWCTPRGSGASDLQPCLAQFRVTPVDVTSRPSSCLINFLLNGRSVLLEMPRKSGGKLTSHLLSAHGGEIFIHTLPVSRSCLEELPSVLEGVGGRVTDYRISDFANHIQNHRLLPLKQITDRLPDENLLKARTTVCNHSKYFPISLATTLLYNIRQFIEPLLVHMPKPVLNDDEIIQCQQIIYNIVSLEARNEPLSLPMVHHRAKGSKREEQYRILWEELEALILASGKSSGHKTILKCVRECRSRGPEHIPNDKIELEHAMDNLSEIKNMNLSKIAADSPQSPTSIILVPPMDTVNFNTKLKPSSFSNKTLFDIVTMAEIAQTHKRIDFAGRLCTPFGQVAQLYPNLVLKDNTNARDNDK